MYREGVFGSEEGSGGRHHGVGTSSCSGVSESSGTQGGVLESLEDQRCNGSLQKQPTARVVEDSNGQRYSADPTIFLGERGARGDTDEDGYMTPMKDKSSTGVFFCLFVCENKSTNYICFDEVENKIIMISLLIIIL